MKKLYPVLIFLNLVTGFTNLFAQAPNISYSTPQIYSINTAITPLTPTNTGGAVPANIYGQVSTVAGTGTNGSTNGAAANASFNSPTRIAVDAANNFYVADRDNNQIRKISSTGIVSTFASGGFNLPNGVTIDPSGNIYIADTDNNLIKQITPSGVITTFAGTGSQASNNGTGTTASFYYPFGITSDATGNLYVADTYNNMIRKITPTGVVTTIAGNGIAGAVNGAGNAATFNHPNCVAIDAVGNLLVTDPGNNLIRKITPAGVVSTFAGNGVTGFANGPAASASFNGTGGVCIDKVGNVFEADLNNNQIRRIDLSGNVTTLVGSSTAGNVNGVGSAARFFHPNDVQINSTGEVLYVDDYGNNTIRKILITGYAIDKTLPAGLTFDATTGIISGTPTAASPVTTYTITAYNNAGSSSTPVVISVVTTIAQTITFAPITKVYGTADFDPGATASSGLAVNYASSNTAVATIVAGKIHITGVGTTTITASQAGNATYSPAANVSQTLPVTPAQLTITADNKTKAYATANPSLTVSYSGFVYGETSAVLSTQVTIATIATLLSNAGSYPITLSGGSAANYTITNVAGSLTITLVPLTITADNKTKAYGSANPALTISYAGFVNGETSTVFTTQPAIATTATVSSNVGVYPTTVTGAAATNYTITNIAGSLTITPVPLILTADDQRRPYAQPNPTLTFTASGFVNGDGPTNLTTQPLLTTTATTASPLGNYPISISGAADANYIISYVPGTLAVLLAQTITTFPPPPTKVYGAANFTLTASASSGLPVSFAGSNNAIATVTAAGVVHIVGVGTITITASQSGDANYASAPPITQTFTVTPAPLTITADNQTKVYGTANPTLTISYAGFVYGETSTVLTTQPTAATTATVTSNVGTYPITVTGATAANYTITNVTGTLTITQATRTLTFNALAPKTYGDADFDPGATITTNEAITYTSSNTSLVTIVNGKIHIIGAGTVTITASVVANTNYNAVAPISQVLVINKATQTITFNPIPDQRKGDPDITLVATASSGLPVTIVSSDPTKAPITGFTVKLLDIGLVTFTATQAGDANYLPAIAIQTLKIEKALPGLVAIHQLVTPNGDGINDVLLIEGIDKYPVNTFTLTTRNGLKIYQVDGYDNAAKAFVGYSNITNTLQQQGTYFYELDFVAAGVKERRTGFIVLKY